MKVYKPSPDDVFIRFADVSAAGQAILAKGKEPETDAEAPFKQAPDTVYTALPEPSMPTSHSEELMNKMGFGDQSFDANGRRQTEADNDEKEYDEHGRRNFDKAHRDWLKMQPPQPLAADGTLKEAEPAPAPTNSKPKISSAEDAMQGSVAMAHKGSFRKTKTASDAKMESSAEKAQSSSETSDKAKAESSADAEKPKYGLEWPPPVIHPAPLPPKIPVISPTECGLLEKAIVMEPAAKCTHVRFSSNWDGCDCFLHLLGTHQVMPVLDYNPFAQTIPADPSVPGFPAPPTFPPPSNGAQPYAPPAMPTFCPFADSCAGKGFDCVGFDSFGFAEVRMGRYSPASRYFNSINCFYIMKPYNQWLLPKKVEAFWYLQQKRANVEDFYLTEMIEVKCKSEVVTDQWHVFCEDYIFFLKFSCDHPWWQLFKGDCKGAPPPGDFPPQVTLGDVCPFECGFKAGFLHWPYHRPGGGASALLQ